MASDQTSSQDVLRMIEEKRLQAIELRKRKLEEQKCQQSNNEASSNKQANRPISFQKTLPAPRYTGNNSSKTSFNQINKIHQKTNQNAFSNVNFTQIKNRSTNSSPVKKQLIEKTMQMVKSSNTAMNDGQKVIKMSAVLEDANRFCVSCDYETDIIKIFRDTDSKKWDPISKKWSFSLADFYQIFVKIQKLKNLNIQLVDSIPETVINTLIEANKSNTKIPVLTERLESKFVEGLYDFQREGIIFGIQREGRCLIADDMGLGKTIQAIALAMWYRENWPLIIVCPSSLRFQWVKSILRWVDDLSEKDIFVVQNTKDIFPKVPVTITSYDLMARLKTRFTVDTNRFYNMIIMDESHYIKSDVAQRTSTALLIARSCKRVLLLSGTPALSKPIELFPQLNILNKDIFPSKHAYGIRYCDAKQKTFFKGGKPVSTWDYNGSKNLDELRIILENTFMIRRLKKDVLNQLPNKKREMVCISCDHLTEKEKSQMNAIRHEVVVAKRKDRMNLVLSWFGKSAVAKIPAVNEYLLDVLKRDIKLICFCHHKTMMDGVEEMLNREKINHIRIDGSTPAKLRQDACEIFQKNPSFKVALLSITACATGLNLTAASMVIFAETYWNPGVVCQAEDRVHRIGQLSNVRVIYLVARATIDELIWPMLSKKLEILNKAGLSRDTFSDTANPLEQKEDQTLIDEFVNALDHNEIQSLFNA